jgi:hypothetical protein
MNPSLFNQKNSSRSLAAADASSHPTLAEGDAIFMRTIKIFALAATAVVMVSGCHSKMVNTAEFRSALNNYYASRQECLWNQTIKFPVQANASDESQTAQFDALTDAGLLKRTPGEKQRFLIGSKRVNNYDLSSKGHSDWTADPAQPGYGNFCVGNPAVKSIDSYTPNNNPNATQYAVTYRYAVSLPDWANTAEIKTAFPRAANASQGQEASATLVKNQNGWQVQNVSDLGAMPQP